MRHSFILCAAILSGLLGCATQSDAPVTASPAVPTTTEVVRIATAPEPAIAVTQADPQPQKAPARPPAPMTDAQAIAAIMRNSLVGYPGNCPCPENRMANGRRCGATSAWSRPGGYKPICYAREVTPAMIEAYRARTRGS